MKFLYHASQSGGIKELRPFVSNHGTAQIYFSNKRENVLVYLSNAVEKYCRETGFQYEGIWYKWASYGFDECGKMQFEEYYPNALYDTYKGVSGFVYSVRFNESFMPLLDIPNAYTSTFPRIVDQVEYVADAYDAIIEAENLNLLTVVRYDQLSADTLKWIEEIIPKEFSSKENHPEYRHFLMGKFPQLFD